MKYYVISSNLGQSLIDGTLYQYAPNQLNLVISIICFYSLHIDVSRVVKNIDLIEILSVRYLKSPAATDKNK